MTRNQSEPAPEKCAAGEWRHKAHVAVDELLDHAHLQRQTGRLQVIIDVNEGGVRAVRIVTDVNFKPKC